MNVNLSRREHLALLEASRLTGLSAVEILRRTFRAWQNGTPIPGLPPCPGAQPKKGV